MSGDQLAGGGDGDRLGNMVLRGVQVALGQSGASQVGKGGGEFGEVVPVSEASC
ncbi:MAG TPA: hypothetical protein VFJ07_24180 [Streptosporangiaceae bacterium]|nr:hypothetical protein [Streptosporangiaceae bacterium]